MAAGGTAAPGVTAVQAASWIQTVPLQDAHAADQFADLDRGEAEVLALAQEVNATLVIIDERIARWYARQYGVRLTGSIDVLLRAEERGHIPAIKALLTELRQGHSIERRLGCTSAALVR